MEYKDNVIIQNGIEIEVNNRQYLSHLRANHKPVTWELLESLEERDERENTNKCN